MRYGIFYLALASLLVFLLLQGNSSGYASVNGEGRTGAPADNLSYCANCHGTGNQIQVSAKVELLDTFQNVVSSYEAGKEYLVRVSIIPEKGVPAGYGFQLLCWDPQKDSAVNQFLKPAPNVQVSLAKGRQYPEQNGVSSNNTFDVRWIAPAADSVIFYAAGVGVNNNKNSNGDGAARTSLKTQAGWNATDELAKQVACNIYPNPFCETVRINIHQAGRTNALHVRILDAAGKPVEETRIPAGIQEFSWEPAVETLRPGFYILQMTDGRRTLNRKLVRR